MFGQFSAPVLGMLAQSSAFGTVSQNIANVNTGGYKATDTRFSTILASTFDNNDDVGGLKTVRKNYISAQGLTLSTPNPLDLAINGRGFFVVNSQLDGSGDEFYTRDGAFSIATPTTGTTTVNSSVVTISQGYLVDKNGFYLQGYAPDDSGNFTDTSLQSLRVDRTAFSSDAQPTTTASLGLNLPATDAAGTVETETASIYDSNGNTKTFNIQWTKGSVPQQWTLQIVPVDSAIAPLPSSETFTFDNMGNLPSGTTHNFTVNWADGQVSTVALDLSNVTSIGSNLLYTDFQKDGRVSGDLDTIGFSDQGYVVGNFSNGAVRNLYQLPLATFIAPDQLEQVQGNLFTVSTISGTPTYRAGDIDGFATFTPFAHELSNTNLSAEFSKMILVQQAYNSSATVFKTVDEMTQTAAELKT